MIYYCHQFIYCCTFQIKYFGLFVFSSFPFRFFTSACMMVFIVMQYLFISRIFMSNMRSTWIMFSFIITSSPYCFSSYRTFNLIIVTLLSIDIFYLPAYLLGITALLVATFSASDRGMLVITCLAIASVPLPVGWPLDWEENSWRLERENLHFSSFLIQQKVPCEPWW